MRKSVDAVRLHAHFLACAEMAQALKDFGERTQTHVIASPAFGKVVQALDLLNASASDLSADAIPLPEAKHVS